MLGMTSVTFRDRPVQAVVQLTAEAGLDGIEWGSDVHVRPGDRESALSTARATREAGLRVLSYGSYYRLCESGDPENAFRPYLDTAAWLGAPMIRVWPGGRCPQAADEAYFKRAAAELRLLCRMAARREIAVSTEFHPGSLTETPEGALRLLRCAGTAGTYWQCDPDRPFAWNAAALQKVLAYMTNVHVFYWREGKRRLLSEGWEDWSRYLRIIRSKPGPERNFILEFTRDNDPAAFTADAAALREWMGKFEKSEIRQTDGRGGVDGKETGGYTGSC